MIVPSLFIVLCAIGMMGAGVSFGFLKSELAFRFVANGITILALLIPIQAGMGLNFALTLGALSSQVAVILVSERMIRGGAGLFVSMALSIAIAAIVGNIVGHILNRAKGKEMITSIVLGFLGGSLYQLVFMVMYGRVIVPQNKELLLSSGVGIRNMVDIYDFKLIMDKASALPIIATFACAAFIVYITRTRFGNKIRAVGQSMELAHMQGINVDLIRRHSIVISTVLASIGHFLYMVSMGNVNVYTGHLNIDVFACASLLAGGATLRRASVWNAFLGLFLFHTLFIVSPLAGQNYFSNVAIGEYFRSFAAYGVIVVAFIINIRTVRESPA
jgi:simple sugar transport system permease protein